jgi:hypothetical protein
MAHNLNYNNLTGNHSFFAATGKNGKPWHGLGQLVQDAQT